MFEGMPKNNSFYGNSRNKASNEDFVGSGRSFFDRLSATGGIQSESDGMDTDSEVDFGTLVWSAWGSRLLSDFG